MKEFLALLAALIVIVAVSMLLIHANCKFLGTKTIVFGGNTVQCPMN